MEILIYIGKVSLYWVLFYACYRLFLRQQTFFTWNRLYLLGALIVSFGLPFVIYPESAPDLPVMYEVSAAAFSVNYVQPEQASVFTWTNAVILLYFLAVVFRFFKMADNLRQLKRFILEGERVELEDCKVALINSNDVGSFSFLKWIVVNRNDYENHFDAILRHEMVHTSQGHSFDILFVEILRSIFWFNPVLILYKNSLQEVHEYLADEAAPNREHYANFLVSYALNAPIAALTNHFFKPSQIHSRIKMIYKNRTSKWLLATYVIALSLTGVIALLVAGCENVIKPETTSGEPVGKAADILVHGEVIAQDGKAVQGAQIEVEGVQRGTSTDEDGKFTITAPAQGRLSVDSHGYKTHSVPVQRDEKVIVVLGNPGSVEYSKPETTALALNETKPELTDKKIFTVVQHQPVFPGGVRAMYEFLENNLEYPQVAARANVSGRVFLSFVVTENGEIKDVNVLKGLGFGCDQEAIRVLKLSPKWNPGMQDGVPVSVKFNLPIHFQLGRAVKTSPELSSNI